jgi:soluble lytic murein transglycosylase-like protein
MVKVRATSKLVAMSLAFVMSTTNVVHAEPVDWASAGGDLFVGAGPPVDEFMMDRPAPPSPSPIAAPVRQPARRVAPLPIADPVPTEDYGDVRLLPSNQPLDALIQKIATETGLDPKLLHALVIIESAYNTRAVSPVGARGLTQLMPATARELGVSNPFDTEENLRGGARYLALQIGRFNDVRLALAAYNSGPNRVARLGRVPDISETQNYVRDGIDCYLALTAGRGIRHRNQCRVTGGR